MEVQNRPHNPTYHVAQWRHKKIQSGEPVTVAGVVTRVRWLDTAGSKKLLFFLVAQDGCDEDVPHFRPVANKGLVVKSRP